jgi:hypothetical protein
MSLKIQTVQAAQDLSIVQTWHHHPVEAFISAQGKFKNPKQRFSVAAFFCRSHAQRMLLQEEIVCFSHSKSLRILKLNLFLTLELSIA